MSIFDAPVSKYMTETVVTVSIDADLTDAEALLRQFGVTALPVLARDNSVCGVISFTDLMRVGHVLGRMMGSRTALTLPSSCVGDVMTADPGLIDANATLAEAAKMMVDKRYHRIFVTRDGVLSGVISTRDMMLAVCDAEIAVPIAKFASSPVETIEGDMSLFHGIEKLTVANVSGLVVMEDGIPSGLFTQLEAVASRDLPSATKISEVVEYAVICLPWRTPLYRAAGFAANTRARRVLCMDGTEIRGILTALDFVKAALPA